MKKKPRGFITLQAIIVIFLVFSSACFIIYCASLQIPMSMSTLDSVKSKYIIEDKLYSLVYNRENFDKYLSKELLIDCVGKDGQPDDIWGLKLDPDDMLSKNLKEVRHIFTNEKGKRYVNLSMEIAYKNIRRTLEAKISVINEFFERGQGLIDYNILGEEDQEKFLAMMEDQHERSFDFERRLMSSMFLHNLTKDTMIKSIDEGNSKELLTICADSSLVQRRFDKQWLILNLIDPRKERLDLIIGDLDKLNKIKLSAAIYLEGDLIINQDLELEGLIIINDGSLIINSPNPLKIKGMLLYKGDGELDLDKLDIDYDHSTVLRYGAFFPILLEPKIELVKIR